MRRARRCAALDACETATQWNVRGGLLNETDFAPVRWDVRLAGQGLGAVDTSGATAYTPLISGWGIAPCESEIEIKVVKNRPNAGLFLCNAPHRTSGKGSTAEFLCFSEGMGICRL